MAAIKILTAGWSINSLKASFPASEKVVIILDFREGFFSIY